MTVLAGILNGPNECEWTFVECSPEPKQGDVLRIRGRIVMVVLVVRVTEEAESKDHWSESGSFYAYPADFGDDLRNRVEIICRPVDVAALAGERENIAPVTFRREESEVQV